MEYRDLGKTGVRVSAIGLGTWPAGGSIMLGGAPTGYGEVPRSEAVRAIRGALELGVSFFDTSDSYGLGRGEHVLAEAVSGRHGQVVLATKAGWVPDGHKRWIRDLSPEHLIAAAGRSCRRLEVDTLDVFQLHAVPVEGAETDSALDALEELKTRGMVRLTGVSIGSDYEAGLRILKTGRIDVLQVHYNLVQQGAAPELLNAALAARVGVIASVPLAYGFLSGGYTRASIFAGDDWRSLLTREEVAARVERVERYRFLTSDGKRSMSHAALQFVLAHPAVSVTIPGFRNIEQVTDLVRALDASPISDIELARARELGGAKGRASVRV